MSVEDCNVSINQVAFYQETRLRVSVAVNGRQSVFDTSLVAPFVCWATTVRATDLQMLRMWVRVNLVCLSQFVHPTVVEFSTRVVFSEFLRIKIFTTKVRKSCFVVNDVAGFLGSVRINKDFRFDNETWQEVWCW